MQNQERNQWILNAFPPLLGFLDGLAAALFAWSAWRGGVVGRLLFSATTGLIFGLFGFAVLRFLLNILLQVMAGNAKADSPVANASGGAKKRVGKAPKKRGGKGARR